MTERFAELQGPNKFTVYMGHGGKLQYLTSTTLTMWLRESPENRLSNPPNLNLTGRIMWSVC